MKGAKWLIQLVLAIILYFVIFFGIAFILNMLLRRTWLMTVLYPFVIIFLISNNRFSEFFTKPGIAFSETFQQIISLPFTEIIIFSSGLLGTIVSGVVIIFLRRSGYQMF